MIEPNLHILLDPLDPLNTLFAPFLLLLLLLLILLPEPPLIMHMPAPNPPQNKPSPTLILLLLRFPFLTQHIKRSFEPYGSLTSFIPAFKIEIFSVPIINRSSNIIQFLEILTECFERIQPPINLW